MVIINNKKGFLMSSYFCCSDSNAIVDLPSNKTNIITFKPRGENKDSKQSNLNGRNVTKILKDTKPKYAKNKIVPFESIPKAVEQSNAEGQSPFSPRPPRPVFTPSLNPLSRNANLYRQDSEEVLFLSIAKGSPEIRSQVVPSTIAVELRSPVGSANRKSDGHRFTVLMMMMVANRIELQNEAFDSEFESLE